jgi:cytochrome c556
MKSKWLVLGLTAGLFVALLGTLSIAQDDDETPIHAHMEKVQKNQGIILKYWAKRKNSTKEETVAAAKELVTLSEGIKAFGKEEAEKDKKPVEEWNKFTDAGVKAVKDFSDFMGTDKADAKTAKDKYKPVTESCNACHDVFNQ